MTARKGKKTSELAAVLARLAQLGAAAGEGDGHGGGALDSARGGKRGAGRPPAETETPGYWEALAVNTRTWAGEVSSQPFWKAANASAEEWSRAYYKDKKDSLFPGKGLPPFHGKGLPRLKEKALAAIRARGVPAVFPNGTTVPSLDDLVRTRVETRFIDGVNFVADRLLELLKEYKLSPEIKPAQVRASGYYAAHVSFDYSFVYRFGIAKTVSVRCEVQVATELSTTIWDRTHGAYELARTVESDDLRWQWDPEDPRFLASQLAHMIHLADGLVLRLRDTVVRAKGGKK